jgi:Holliday junction resolvase RusA-like endonuclease
MIRFFVGGTPKSMKVGGVARFMKAGKMHFVPKRGHDEWATLVGSIGRDHAPAQLLEGPLLFMATFFVPRPASLPKRSAHLAMPIKRPDADNLFHKLTDQFNGVFWADDSQLVDIVLRKRYPLDGRTGVDIIVAPVTNAQVQAEIRQLLLDREVEHDA